ncbi:hypothetical protein MHK_010813 [Candidatus Magnetomorum sp. HK-1]|nr:hypothetical protein MHK_010813 [Candidatus Magnetomorum sp. HK-1]
MNLINAQQKIFFKTIKENYEFDDSLTFNDYKQDRNNHRNGKILFVLDYLPKWQFYTQLLLNIRDNRRNIYNKIDLVRLCDISEKNLKGYSKVIFAYHDPLKQLYPEVYINAKKLEQICAILNIKLIGKPDALSNTSKSITSQIWRKFNIPTARQIKVNSLEQILSIDDLAYPIFVRYDSGHDSAGKRKSELFFSKKELIRNQCFFEKNYVPKKHFGDIVVTEYIETKSSDGLYRKFRTIVSGDSIINECVQVSKSWFVHLRDTIMNDLFINEYFTFIKNELKYNYKNTLIKANKVLGLDFSGIDWSIDHNGDIILWEANAHPSWSKLIQFNDEYRNQYVDFMIKTLIL